MKTLSRFLKHSPIYILFFLSSNLSSAEPLAVTEMNGIKRSDFQNFEKDWRLVTVRYRKDSNEMRWTFANDLAWKTLASGSISYPDGAIFGKIGVVTHEDSQFTSSAVPSGARRFQFMVRDKVKYAETGGWGYALFDVDGKLFPESIKETTLACYACHRIVENRGQVFSQPFQFLDGSKSLFSSTFFSENKGFHKVQFKTVAKKSLPDAIKKQLPNEVSQIQIVDVVFLQDNLFQGTLDEIKPSLELESYNKNLPAALVSKDGLRFSLIIPIEKEGCKKHRSFRAVTTGPTEIIKSEYCNP